MARSFTASSSQYLSNANAIVTAYPFTLACWFNPNTVDDSDTLISIGDTGSNNDVWILVADGTTAGDPVSFTSRAAGTTRTASTSTGFSASVWQHAVAVGVSSTSRTVYLNGGSSGSNTTDSTPANLDTTAIGVRATLTLANYMNGLIAEAAIWNTNLTVDEVVVLSRGVSPLLIRPGLLIAYWPLIGGYSPEIDLVGSFSMTLTNSPTKIGHYPGIYYPDPFEDLDIGI